ncbi:Pseudomonalisin precursor [Aquisphaera giovannonii]|uniref:Pseudomonalisin n=1 Tax=Aquisphaera giovannonii TaxID=406548 RepID=A0A5B9W459_9BACT|nr:S53 family peptidase [Aquisphaera giovannonii]QEH34885.1 Pseudomonalisin precursor [Aquisphaera giovannonii]
MHDTRSRVGLGARGLAQVRRRQRFHFRAGWEALEDRQLLSTAADLGGIKVTSNLDVTALAGTSTTSGYTPSQVRSAYGVNAVTFSSSGGTVSGTGAGQTIAVVVAYNDTRIASDLATFSSAYGLPSMSSSPSSSSSPTFTVDNLGGSSSRTDAGWALETALDVEWVHAMAPQANIVLVEAASDSLGDMFGAVNAARNLPGVSVVSMSWGATEFLGDTGYDSLFTTPAGHTGVTFVAASGDTGAWYGVMYPASSSNVLAVGGASTTISGSGTIASQSGWSGSTGGYSGASTGFWSYESVPSYQSSTLTSAGLNIGTRTVPDVSFNADPSTGVAVYSSVAYQGQSGWFRLGGTSAAAPAWAGLIAVADQGLSLAGKSALSGRQAMTDLYALPSSDFNDVTSGSNGYGARAGYDLVTGLGTPRANLLIAGIVSMGTSSGTTSTGASSGSTSGGSTSTGTNGGSTGRSNPPPHRGPGGRPFAEASVGSTAGTAATAVTATATTTVEVQALAPTSTTTAAAQATSSTSTSASSSSSTASQVGQSQGTAATLPTQSTPADPAATGSRSLALDSTPHDPLPPSQDGAGDDASPAAAGDASMPDAAPAPEVPASPTPAPMDELPSDPLPILPDEPGPEGTWTGLADVIRARHPMEVAARPQPAGPAWPAAPIAEGLGGDAGWAAPAMAGAVAVAAGAYQLILARADRLPRGPSRRRRWQP